MPFRETHIKQIIYMMKIKVFKNYQAVKKNKTLMLSIKDV